MGVLFQILVNIFLSAFLYMLIATSFFLIYNTVKFFHLAQASVISFGAYATFFFENRLLVPFSVAVLLAIIFSTSIGAICEIIIYRPMRDRNMPALKYLIASIGLYVIFLNLISLYFGDDSKVIDNSQAIAGHEIFGAYITTNQIIILFTSLVLTVAITLILKYSRIGKSIRGVANNPELCNIYGINSNHVILIAFCIGSALGAIAGILSAMDSNITPNFGFNLLLYGVVVMIIGGLGSTKGLVLASFLIAATQHLAAFFIDTKWMDAITYCILILFLIWKPLGFSGQKLKKVEI
ncbi:MAG TPA: branched-chain amino acid ABC transporter permease [Cytophagaceae bacterium]|jgi:branched-chain amino acid transport system permease protein|nr:branched-chain amino acid ABC transporter permease [Cytophagaceae bacterium]